jgi:hypothetical protein
VLASFVQSANDVDAYQFGFTAGHSTSLCTSVFKRTANYYRNLGSHGFVCFIDFTKDFDLISYWKLLDKLLDDDCNPAIIKLLAFWYCRQCACVRWHNVTSQFFGLGNGTRQGGVLSPKLFARYIRELLTDNVNSGVGCNVGGAVMWCLETLSRLETVSRQTFRCLGLGLGLEGHCLGLGLGC